MTDRNEALNLDPPNGRAVAIVPARLSSTRLARKPLVLVGGAPLVVRVCENLLAADVFARIVVACDSDAVAEVVRLAGFEAVPTAPELASGTDRVAACAKTLGLVDDALIVNVQGDEPFVGAETLRDIVAALRQSAAHTVVTAREPIATLAELRDPNLVKVVVGDQRRALYFSRAAIPYVRDEGAAGLHLTDQHFRHVGIYAYRHVTLRAIAALPPHALERLEQLEQLRWLASGYPIEAVLVNPSPRGVDTEADLAAANQHYNRVHHGLR